MLALFAGFIAAPAAATDLTIAISGRNMHAWTSMGECSSYYFGTGNICMELTGVCNDTVHASQRSRHELVAAIRDKSETATVRVMNGGLFPKGSFGDVWCKIGR